MATKDAKESKMPILWSVKLRESIALVGSSPTETVEPMIGAGAHAGWDVSVSGPSVFLVAPATQIATGPLRAEGNRTAPSSDFVDVAESAGLGDPEQALGAVRLAYEVPRAACVLRWVVPADWTGDEVAKAVHKGGFSAIFASPSRELKELRKTRPAVEQVRAAARVERPRQVAQAPMPRPGDVDEPTVDIDALNALRRAARAKQRTGPRAPVVMPEYLGSGPSDDERGWGDPGPVEPESPA